MSSRISSSVKRPQVLASHPPPLPPLARLGGRGSPPTSAVATITTPSDTLHHGGRLHRSASPFRTQRQHRGY
ncbi:hypothetical protein NL676_026704 [Syzygium grande]|nr:hypothetical protein NL676_026704 [Syzygium grande]